MTRRLEYSTVRRHDNRLIRWHHLNTWLSVFDSVFQPQNRARHMWREQFARNAWLNVKLLSNSQVILIYLLIDTFFCYFGL